MKSIIRQLSAAFALLVISFCAQSQDVVEYIHTDALGSPVAITNQAGQVIERTNYEPYGNLIRKANNDRPGYTGHVMDSATGLTYMEQRYYDPLLGRFLSTDPVQANASTGASFNRYNYANNNPYLFKDPDGRDGSQFYTNPEYRLAPTDNLTPGQARFLIGAQVGILLGPLAPEAYGVIRTLSSMAEASKRPEGVPKNWERSRSDDGLGFKWRNPKNEHDFVRTSVGNKNSSNAAQQGRYVVRQADGKRFDAQGNAAPKKSAESHIDPREFKYRNLEELRRQNQNGN